MIVNKFNLTSTLEHLAKQDVLAIDTETTGIRWHDRLFSIEIATATCAYHFDKRILEEEFRKVAQIFTSVRKYYLQNAKFDMRMLYWEGIVLHGTIIDLEVLVRLYRNDVLTTRLKATAAMFGMEKLDIVDEYIKEHKLYTKRRGKHWDKEVKELHYDKVPIEILGKYAAHDARITFDLCEKLIPLIDPRSNEVLNTEIELTPICHNIEISGCLIDQAYTLEKLNYEKGLIAREKEKFLLSTGQIYSGSRSQLMDVFTKAGEDIPRTDKGNPCLDADALETFASPVAKLVQEIRYYEKRCSTYYAAFLDLCDSGGRLHADMRQAGTITGRFSYRDPNLQQLSKEDSAEDFQRSNLIRGCFIPEVGHTLVSMDYAAQELRLMYAYSNQWDMIGAINSGLDPHAQTAQLIGASRNIAKRYAFMLLYGSGIKGIATTLGISEYMAREYYQRFSSKLPMVMSTLAQIKSVAETRGHVYNWAGRKLHLPQGMAANAYAVPNHLIQSSGADICKRAMVDVSKLLPKSGAKIHTQIHDALVFQWPTSNLDMLQEVIDAMENVWPLKNGIGMKVDVKISNKSLSEKDLKKWHHTKNC